MDNLLEAIKALNRHAVGEPSRLLVEAEATEKEFSAKDSFIEEVKKRYPGTTFDGERSMEIPFKAILPSTPLKDGVLYITVRKKEWLIDT